MATYENENQKSHSKPCTLCRTPRDVLVRCQIDSSQKWHLVCPGKCWHSVSGGVIDGDGERGREWYRYGGMWKNKHEAVSAKKPKKRKKRVEGGGGEGGDRDGDGDGGETIAGESEFDSDAVGDWNGGGIRYTRNDFVRFKGVVWVCRKSHVSEEGRAPDGNVGQWKEAVVHTSDG